MVYEYFFGNTTWTTWTKIPAFYTTFRDFLDTTCCFNFIWSMMKAAIIHFLHRKPKGLFLWDHIDGPCSRLSNTKCFVIKFPIKCRYLIICQPVWKLPFVYAANETKVLIWLFTSSLCRAKKFSSYAPTNMVANSPLLIQKNYLPVWV